MDGYDSPRVQYASPRRQLSRSGKKNTIARDLDTRTPRYSPPPPATPPPASPARRSPSPEAPRYSSTRRPSPPPFGSPDTLRSQYTVRTGGSAAAWERALHRRVAALEHQLKAEVAANDELRRRAAGDNVGDDDRSLAAAQAAWRRERRVLERQLHAARAAAADAVSRKPHPTVMEDDDSVDPAALVGRAADALDRASSLPSPVSKLRRKLKAWALRAALADFEETEERSFVLKTQTERDKDHGVARRARVGEAPKILTKIAAATNVTVKNFRLTFRDAWVRAKYGRKASKGRSILEMAMAAPHLLKREGASGNGQAFPVARAFIVDGDAAWELVHSKPHAAIQKVGTPTIKCRQSNLKGVLELDVLGKEKYVVPYKSIKAMAWDFIDASLPANVDGIVVVTFAIVTAGRLQLLTLELLQKDKNTCRMFANLAGLQNTLFKSALVAGGEPSPQAQLLRAAHREGGSGTAVLDLEKDEAPWRRVAVQTAVAASRGLVRIAEVDAEEPPPLSTILKKYKGGDGITMRKEAIRSSSTTKAKRGRPKAKEDDGARVVRAELENHEEAARYQKDGGKVLGEKWVGLCVRDDEYRFAGEIVGMKWVDDTDPPQICAEIRSYDKKDTQTYCVYDLPAMVIAAEDEQLLDVLLEYDPPEDEFDLPGDEEAERTMAQPLEPDDDDDVEDDDVDLEL